MNSYEKWGRDFTDSLMRHLSAALTIWAATEIKYQEINFRDLGLFLVAGAVVPTLREVFAKGLPPMETVSVTTATTTIEQSKLEPLKAKEQ
jgi:hypothetical protein